MVILNTLELMIKDFLIIYNIITILNFVFHNKENIFYIQFIQQ
jgi:hypothetical protein